MTNNAPELDNGHTCALRNDGAGPAYQTSAAVCPRCLDDLPAHKRPDACYVCENGRDRHSSAGSHRYWSNADALAEAAKHDARATFRYSSGATSPEAAYVDDTRGR